MQPPPRPILLIGSLIGLFLGPHWGSLQPVRAQSPPSLTALLKDCTDHANAGDNPAVRTLALSGIVAIESRSNPDRTLRGDALPLLESEVPRIAAHLADDDTH